MKSFILTVVLITFLSCNNESSKLNMDASYKKEFKSFKKELSEGRINYLQLTGLFKLDSLDNTFGKDTLNDLTLNIESLPSTIGTILVGEGTLSFSASENVLIKNEQDSSITNIHLILDEFGSSVKLYHHQLNWQVITRAGQLYLRVWDVKNPAVDAFKGFESFDLNSEFIFEGQFTYYDIEKTEAVKSKLGVNTNTNFIGNVSFEYQGETHTLDVGTDGFTMVGDDTTGDDTYGGGRYMYLDLPETNGKVIIDFNRLYNPPCVFSEFTTCLYPPRQNVLPFKIVAGEKVNSL